MSLNYETLLKNKAPSFRHSPNYLPRDSSLDEHLRGELRILLADETRRWIKQDVPAGRTAKAHLAIARRSGPPF